MKFGIRIPPPQMGPIGDPDFVIRYARLVESLGFVTVDEARDTITLLRAGKGMRSDGKANWGE